MYSPKIQADLVDMLSDIRAIKEKPLTALVDELLRPQVIKRYGEVVGSHRHTLQLTLFETGESYTQERVNISSPADVWRLCVDMTQLQQERLDVLTLDTKNHVTSRHVVFLGSLNATVIHPREIYVHAITRRAASIIIVHNHPTGDTSPSPEDIRATEQLKKAGEIISVPLLDHVIVGNGYSSLKEDGHM